MKMTFSPNVLLLPSRLINTINTRFSFLASSACSRVKTADPELVRWWFLGVSSSLGGASLESGNGRFSGKAAMGVVVDEILDGLEGIIATMNCSFNATYS